VQPGRQPRDRVAFGARIDCEDENGARLRYRIIDGDEAKPERGSISHISPLAQAAIRNCK